MDYDLYYREIRTRRLPEKVVEKTISDFFKDHKISEQERVSRFNFVSWEKDKSILSAIVSRTAYFATSLLEQGENSEHHDLQRIYHEMGLNYLYGNYAKLANFTFCVLVDRNLAKNFTVEPSVRLTIATVVRTLGFQSASINSENRLTGEHDCFINPTLPG